MRRGVQGLPEACGGSLADKAVLDVGSRLGAAVYAAVLLGRCRAAVGVEMNAELCAVQAEAVGLFGLAQRGARVVCADVTRTPEEVAQADVVLLHSAFQFFQTPEQSRAIWDYMRRTVPPHPHPHPPHRRKRGDTQGARAFASPAERRMTMGSRDARLPAWSAAASPAERRDGTRATLGGRRGLARARPCAARARYRV